MKSEKKNRLPILNEQNNPLCIIHRSMIDRHLAEQGCGDVFVTETGKSAEPVIGWLTNVQIAEVSKA